MVRKTFKLTNRIVDINIFDTAFHEEDNCFFFGHPLDYIKNSDYNTIKGPWLKITIKKDEVVVVTDIIGTYRLYYLSAENFIYISDNYSFLLGKISEIKINKIEYEYWKKHDYTTGGKTLFVGVNKFKPATENIIKDNSFEENLYFKNLPREYNSIRHTEMVFTDLDHTFDLIKKTNTKVVLMFSGGKDSCLLALFLKKQDIDFVSVFLKLEPTFTQAYLDYQKVLQVSEALGIKTDIITVKVNSFSKDESNKIHQVQLLDKHFTAIHYRGAEEIKKAYGSDILILNGSTSDSIFTFGPSENSKISYLRRNIMFNSKSLISKIAVQFLNLKARRHFRLGKNEDELLLALMDEYKYCRVLDKEKDEDYYDYLLKQLSFAKKVLTTFNSMEMYTKTYTFLQGSTQQVIHNSCRFHKLKYIMPFASPGVIYATMKYRNDKLEITQPKYCVERILKEKFNFDYNNIKLDYNNQTFSYNLDELRKNVNEEFEKCLSASISKTN
ncbi:tRNA lysidine(34) synthetase [Gelidibacter maritimus]|uniref:Asparagine synthetase domain-containing protein n=1 Tax=Gelidibacter maritimus TaxID=2761487 RepID=A0A7W2R2L1_9FLAO|nr:hypothetical protein [Gelidibacter maritimus]MBA6151931.1 hypothetical protein [Gelidibacter maritimus]